MADLQSDRFIRDNITALESIRERCKLSTELYRTLMSLLEDWQTVESVCFKVEPKYANSPLKPLLKEPTNSPNRFGQDMPNSPGNLPIPQSHGYTIQPLEEQGTRNRKKTDSLQNRSPQLPPRSNVPQQEGTYPSPNRPLPPPPPPITDKRAPNNIPSSAWNPNTNHSSSEEIRRYLSQENEKAANAPFYMNTQHTNPTIHPNNKQTEIHLGRDWSHQNSENARLPTTVIPPIEVFQADKFYPDPMPQATHRAGMVELNILGEGNTIIHGSQQNEYYNHPRAPARDKEETISHRKKSGTYPRDRPQLPTPGEENYLNTPGSNIEQPEKLRIERSTSIDVLGSELKPQLPPRRKSVEILPPRLRMHLESKPGDPEYTNLLDTHPHKLQHGGNNGNTFFDSNDKDLATGNDNETQEIDNLSNENEPLKTSDDYLMVFHALEDDKHTQYKEEKEEDRLAVFNPRELISDKTELATDQQGVKRRRVQREKTYSQEEVEFYNLISNHSVFYLYLSEHNVLIQELLSLEQPIGKVLRDKLAPYYNVDLGKLVIMLGAQIGLLEVNDKMNAALQKMENFLKKFYSKGKTVLDPKLSLHQSNITTSHLICVSQSGSIFDQNNFDIYIREREMNLTENFQRLFVPLIQGTVPLRKDEIKNLISYLTVIYRIKEWEMLVPEIYKRDQEMKSEIDSSIGLIYKSSPEEVMPQVTKLVRDSKMRESIYFYVKINNKLDRKLTDAVLGVSTRNIHLISVSRSCEIDLVYMWGLGDLETWRTCVKEREIVIKFNDGTRLLISSPELNEELIHVVLKSAIDYKKFMVIT